MTRCRKLKRDPNYIPALSFEGDEIFPNGIFHFNISRILEDISSSKLDIKQEVINVSKWFKSHFHGSVNEDYLASLEISKPVLQAEIRPGMFNIIDGNHRLERAFRDKVNFINSYKLKGEQLVPYFTDLQGYEAFIEYWNSNL